MINIEIIGDATECIYTYTFKKYLNKVADILEKKYDYQLNARIELNKTDKNDSLINIKVFLPNESVLTIDKLVIRNFKYNDLHKFNPNNKFPTYKQVFNINTNCTTPIEIEVGIVQMLLEIIYIIDGENDYEFINIHNAKKYEELIKPWLLNISTSNHYIYSKVDELYYLDALRSALKLITQPVFTSQIETLKKSNIICHQNDSKANAIASTCSSAIDMIFDHADYNFNIVFPRLESFDISVIQIGNKAKLKMEVEITTEDNDDISDVSFTVNYTDNFNSLSDIPDPSKAIASLLMNFYHWYFSAIENNNNNKKEMEFNFKESIMAILPVNI